jgi:signal peptidase
MSVSDAAGSPGFLKRPRAPLADWLQRTLTLVACAAVVLALLPWLLVVAGFQPLVVLSGSMEPAISAGDAIVTRGVNPSAVRVGDVVTFVDQTRGNQLITHRVVEARHDGAQYSFVTKGDSNTGVDRWSIDQDGTLGQFAFRVPKLGFIITVMSTPIWRALFGAIVLGTLTVAVVRRIWA